MTRQVLALALLAAALPVAGTAPAADAEGTTIVGEREAAVGLYLAPWQGETASDVDRPPALHDVPPQSIDPQRFRRLADYDEAIRDYRRERLFRSR
ncbi:hypothetical protein AAG565_07055 [Fontimonas sp. SYSU GA230001]|uniref:hypothetical protein n=1 Tax=Fontimonas sp. SYSU GA230001 TaxID=3142450 RepID=UPI0032B54E80